MLMGYFAYYNYVRIGYYLFTNFTDATENYEVKLVLVNDDFGCETSKTVNVAVTPMCRLLWRLIFLRDVPILMVI